MHSADTSYAPVGEDEKTTRLIAVGGEVANSITFDGQIDPEALAPNVLAACAPMLEQHPYTPDMDWNPFRPFAAEAMTRRQMGGFDRVVSTGRTAEAHIASDRSGQPVWCPGGCSHTIG
jgi:hypothetical protein